MGLVQKAEVGMCVLCAVALFSVPCTLPLIRIACLPSHQLSKIKKWRVKVKPHMSLCPTQLHSGQTICGELYLPSNMIFYRAICYSGILKKGFASPHYFSDSLSARKRDSVNKTQTSTSECTCKYTWGFSRLKTPVSNSRRNLSLKKMAARWLEKKTTQLQKWRTFFRDIFLIFARSGWSRRRVGM